MKHLKRLISSLFGITPFKITLALASFFTLISFIQDVSTNGLPLISTFENKSLDLKFYFRGPRKPQSKVVIAAIDEKAMATYGQWPFDRANVLAPIIDKICSYNIKVLGLDVFWPEIERNISSRLKTSVGKIFSSASQKEEFEILLKTHSGDTVMHQALARCGSKAVLGYYLTADIPSFTTPEDTKNYETRKRNLIDSNKIADVQITKAASIPHSLAEFENPSYEPNTDFTKFKFGAVLNNSIIAGTNSAQGYLDNDSESDDGNYRHYVPLMALDGQFLPSIALRMAMKYFSTTSTNGSADAPLSLFLPDQSYGRPMSIKIKATQDTIPLPVDKAGRLTVNYRGPNYMFPHISVADLMNNSDTITFTPIPELWALNNPGEKDSPKPITYLKRELLENSLVILGSTTTGIFDLRPRPFEKMAYGVENHATVLDNIISNDFLEKPSPETLMILLVISFFASMGFGYCVNRLGAKSGALFSIASIALVLYLDQRLLFDEKRIVFSGPLQALQLLFQYIVVTVLKYAKEEAEKKFIRGAFDKFVSPEVIAQLVADPSKLRIGGEKKEITILFSDVAGFTELSEKLDVKILTQFLNEYLGAMTDIVQANGGTLDKYIGDAVMAFWGAPLPNKRHAELAVKTAVEMQHKIKELNKSFREKYGFEIEVRIGLNTGEVSVGNFGSTRVFSYTIIGDNVNLASRLEGVNKYYGTGVLISDSVYTQVDPNQFVFREIDLIKVKGKKKPVKIYQVLFENMESAKRDLLPSFQKGLQAYYGRRWEEAIQHFTEALKSRKDEKASQEFIERCQYYLKNPPEETWDGSWEMHSK